MVADIAPQPGSGRCSSANLRVGVILKVEVRFIQTAGRPNCANTCRWTSAEHRRRIQIRRQHVSRLSFTIVGRVYIDLMGLSIDFFRQPRVFNNSIFEMGFGRV
jgi:hypothetical protein